MGQLPKFNTENEDLAWLINVAKQKPSKNKTNCSTF
jgi:hypothetical protein